VQSTGGDNVNIVKVKIENSGLVSLLELPLDGRSVKFEGPNNAGKSTAIGAVWRILEKHPMVTIGEDKETLTMILNGNHGKIVCKRINTAGGSSKIIVHDESGETIQKAVWDRFLPEVSADPLKLFHARNDRERIENLLLCSDIDIDTLSAKKKELSSEIENRKRQAPVVDIARKNMGTEPEKIETTIDIEQLQEEIKQCTQSNENITKEKMRIASLKSEIDTNVSVLSRISEEIKRLEDRMLQLRNESANIEKTQEQLRYTLEISEEYSEGIVENDIATLNLQLNHAIAINHKKTQYDEWLKRQEAYLKEQEKYNKYDARVKALDSEISDMLAKVKYPIPGIGIKGEEVFYNGIRYVDLSTSQKILVACALTAQKLARDPHCIKAMLIDETSGILSETMDQILKVCHGLGVQLFFSRAVEGSTEVRYEIV
jgi:hypothetical protein